MIIEALLEELSSSEDPAVQELLSVISNRLEKNTPIQDSLHRVQQTWLNDEVPVTTDENGDGRDPIGDAYFDRINLVGGGGTVNADEPRQIDLNLGGTGAGADCMFDYLVSECFATLPGFVEGTAYTSVSGCIFYGYSTVQPAVTAAIATATKKVIYICGGTYAESVVIDVGGNHPDRQPDLIGAGNDRTYINSIHVISGGNANSGFDVMRDFGLFGDGSRIFRTAKSSAGFNAGLHLKCQNITFGVTGVGGGEIFIAEANFSLFESCEFKSSNEWFNVDRVQIHACQFISAPVMLGNGSGSTCDRMLWANNTFRDSKISVGGGFGQGLEQCSFVNNGHSVTAAATAAFEFGTSSTSALKGVIIEGSLFALNGGTISGGWINILNLSGVSENSISIVGNTWDNPGVSFVKSADVDTDTVTVVGNSQQQSAAGFYLEQTGGFTVSGNFNNSVFGLNAPGQVTNYSLTGTGNTVEGIGQVTAAPGYAAAEGSLAFDKTANTMYVNTNGSTGWAVLGTAGGGAGAPADATYVVLSANPTLTQERVLTAGTGITITDGGANSTVTISASAGAAIIKQMYISFGEIPGVPYSA